MYVYQNNQELKIISQNVQMAEITAESIGTLWLDKTQVILIVLVTVSLL